MDTTGRPAAAERFMPDWVVCGAARLALVPGLWMWGRANASLWPGVMPETVHAAQVWAVPLIDPVLLAQLAVWGAQISAVMLLLGVLTRLVGLALLVACGVYMTWIAPDAWPAAVLFAALAFHLFARGGGALSVDGAIVATTR